MKTVILKNDLQQNEYEIPKRDEDYKSTVRDSERLALGHNAAVGEQYAELYEAKCEFLENNGGVIDLQRI